MALRVFLVKAHQHVLAEVQRLTDACEGNLADGSHRSSGASIPFFYDLLRFFWRFWLLFGCFFVF